MCALVCFCVLSLHSLASLVVIASAVDCLERLGCEVNCYISSWLLAELYSLVHSQTGRLPLMMNITALFPALTGQIVRLVCSPLTTPFYTCIASITQYGETLLWIFPAIAVLSLAGCENITTRVNLTL